MFVTFLLGVWRAQRLISLFFILISVLISVSFLSIAVTAKLTMCLFGPPNDDHPNGVELPMKAKTQKERDQFVDMMVQWRDAATYNF